MYATSGPWWVNATVAIAHAPSGVVLPGFERGGVVADVVSGGGPPG
ncbi:MAG: hypothetical protein M5U09_17670 [Gammaproteobacteria bacterium]|nr:hypothetical protein [Gammaproteobacteria bacterium]